MRPVRLPEIRFKTGWYFKVALNVLDLLVNVVVAHVEALAIVILRSRTGVVIKFALGEHG